jgi:salicylate hydroxylase
MLPFGGQGSNQAIEDSAALGYVLKGAENPADISGRLSLFEKVRKDRATRVQILSKVRAGREQEVEKELQKYADPPGSRMTQVLRRLGTETNTTIAVPTTMQGRTMHDYRHVTLQYLNYKSVN